MDFDVSTLMSGGGNIFEKVGQLKIMLPSFAELMKLELKKGEDEMMFLGTLEQDEKGKTIPIARMIAVKEMDVILPNGEKVAKMVVERVVVDEDNKPKEWNLLNFFSMLNGNESEEE